jgi:hypothetical protein
MRLFLVRQCGVSRSPQLGKPISIELSVENPGIVLGQAVATMVGKHNGKVVVCRQR